MRRRSFLGLLGLGAAAPVLANVAPAAPPPAPLPVPPPTTPLSTWLVGDGTVIDGGMIATGSIRAECITLSPRPDWMAPNDR